MIEKSTKKFRGVNQAQWGILPAIYAYTICQFPA